MNQGDIYLVNFDPNMGSEISKTRPAIIVNNDVVGALPLKIVVPITALRNVQLWHYELTPNNRNGLRKQSIADCFQVKSISNERFVQKIGHLDERDMLEVKGKLALVMDLI